jgi:hypothetical protein
MKPRLLASLALALAAAAPVSAAITPFSLDFSSDPGASVNAGGRTALTFSTSIGVDGNAGRMDFTNINQVHGLAYGTSLGSFGVGDSVTIQYSFLTNGSSTFGNSQNLGGIVIGSATSNLLATDNTNFELILRRQDSLFGTGNTGIRVRSHDGATQTQQTGGAFANAELAASGWFTFSTTITRTAGNNFSVSATLVDVDEASTVSSFSGSFSNASVAAAGDLRAGFLFFNDGTNASAIAADNFSAIPEPSAFAALAGLAGLGLAGLRRRRSA